MKIPAKTFQIIPAEPVLVPPVLHLLHIPGEHQQKRRERAQIVNPEPLLDPHPVLQLLGVPAGSPPGEIDDHNAGVEIAGVPVIEDGGE